MEAVVIIGMHRSGTSALSRAVSFFGFAQPERLLPTQADNPKGYWEPFEVVTLNDQILNWLSARWDRPGPWMLDGNAFRDTVPPLTHLLVERWRNAAMAALAKSYGESERFVLKDPRLCILLPFWRAVFAELQLKVKFVLIYRNPLEVSASLSKRNGLDASHALWLWQHYNLEALELALTGNVAAIVQYEELVRNPRQTLSRLMEEIGGAAELCESSLSEAALSVSEGDWNQRATMGAAFSSPLVAVQLKKTLRLLRDWDSIGEDDRTKQILSLRRSFQDAVLISGRAISLATSELPVTSSQGDEGDGETGLRVAAQQAGTDSGGAVKVDTMRPIPSEQMASSSELAPHAPGLSPSNLVFCFGAAANSLVDDLARAEIIAKEFRSLDEFVSFAKSQPDYFSAPKLQEKVERIRTNGIYCNVHREIVPPERLQIHPGGYRETLVYRGFNSRMRGAYYAFDTAAGQGRDMDLKIFAPEAVTQYALFLRGRFPKFLGSEYATDPAKKRELFPIPAEDLQALSFPDQAFDIAIPNEVFEHVPDLDKALSELARILKPGGKLVATFPFLAFSEDSVVRARLDNGEIVHVTEPEYHGNPVDPKGSLVFEIPGWNIVARTQAAGFSDVKMIWIQSVACGILATDYGGILVLSATK